MEESARGVFDTLLEAKVLIERWRKGYNTVRPHSSLGYRPPAPESRRPCPLASATPQRKKRLLTTRPILCSVQHYCTLNVMTMKTISAADANRHFSRVLREVSQGEHVTVVSRGRPVATIAPVRGSGRERQAAKRILLERLRQQPAAGARNWTRDELYEN